MWNTKLRVCTFVDSVYGRFVDGQEDKGQHFSFVVVESVGTILHHRFKQNGARFVQCLICQSKTVK